MPRKRGSAGSGGFAGAGRAAEAGGRHPAGTGQPAGHPARSQNPGAAHTCGHDAHAAMLLGAARLLKRVEDQLEGCLLYTSRCV